MGNNITGKKSAYIQKKENIISGIDDAFERCSKDIKELNHQSDVNMNTHDDDNNKDEYDADVMMDKLIQSGIYSDWSKFPEYLDMLKDHIQWVEYMYYHPEMASADKNSRKYNNLVNMLMLGYNEFELYESKKYTNWRKYKAEILDKIESITADYLCHITNYPVLAKLAKASITNETVELSPSERDSVLNLICHYGGYEPINKPKMIKAINDMRRDKIINVDINDFNEYLDMLVANPDYLKYIYVITKQVHRLNLYGGLRNELYAIHCGIHYEEKMTAEREAILDKFNTILTYYCATYMPFKSTLNKTVLLIYNYQNSKSNIYSINELKEFANQLCTMAKLPRIYELTTNDRAKDYSGWGNDDYYDWRKYKK